MKKTNLKSAFLILALSIGAGSFLVGCSNSEDLSNELTPKEGMGIVSFSIDETVVALQAHFGVRLQGDRMVRKHMMNIRDLAAFIREQHQKA